MSKWRIKLLAWAIYINTMRIPHKWALTLSTVLMAETARQLCSFMSGTITIYDHVFGDKWSIWLVLFLFQITAYVLGRYDQYNKDEP